MTGDVRVDGLLRVVLGPVVVSGARGAPPFVTVERVTLSPRWLALLAGRLEVASVALDGMRIEPGAGEILSHLARSAGARSGPTAPRSGHDLPDLTFTRIVVSTGSAAEWPPVELGPFSGHARFVRDGVDTVAQVALSFPGAGRGDVRLRWGAGSAALLARLRRLGPEALPEPLRAGLPFELAGGSLDLDIDAPRISGAEVGEASVRAALDDLSVRWGRLASEPVGPLTVRLGGTVRWDLGKSWIALERSRVDLGNSGRAGASLGVVLTGGSEPHIELVVRASDLDWEAAVTALPPALSPPPEAPSVRGVLSARLSVAGPLGRPAAWRVDGDIDPSGLGAAPSPSDALDLAGPFTWRAPLPERRSRDVVLGPQNPAFVPLAALPPHVVRAVLTSEDAGFYGHHGFDLAEIQDALARSGERRLRGASTITQQIAKNLFLSVERTLARKGREALATLALEASLGKRRLLEIYLNMAEWGPGVFGIGEAARHWFAKDARDLSPKEAAFLASVIPNPVRYEMYRRRGALTDRWEDRVRELLVKLRAADVIDDEQLEEAWDAPLEFAGGGQAGAQPPPMPRLGEREG